MYIPKYWMKAEFEGPNRKGATMKVEAWGWSDLSEADARQKALSRAQENLARLPVDDESRYRGKDSGYYNNSPCREVILQDSSRGNVRTVVTRNSLGCEVLNTDSVGFADIDYVPERKSLFAMLFGLGKEKAAQRKAGWESQTLEKLRTWQRENPTWTFRVYRTAGGFRLLETSRLLKPESAETKSWLQAMGSDPLYQTLCYNQKSFRARLTPKPWRCGVSRCPARSIWEGTYKEAEMRKWLEIYQRKSSGFATCEYLETMGGGAMLAECREVVDLHDARTGANSGMALA